MKKKFISITGFSLIVGITLALFMEGAFVSCDHGTGPKQETVYYNVAFDSNGGSAVQSQRIQDGKTAEKPEAPQKTSGSATFFGEWYSDPELTTLFDFSTPITKDTVLYAKWLTIPLGSYLVSFNSGIGQEVPEQIVKAGEKVAEPDQTLVKNGYAFSYWYTTDENQPFDFAASPINQTTVLNAKWNQSGIYEAAFEAQTLYSINLYEDLEMDEASGAW